MKRYWNAFNGFEKQPHNITDALIYARVSSKAQLRRGDGLRSQETRRREYAKYKRYDVAEVFTDDLTGSDAGRPGFQKLLAFIKRDRQTRRFVVIVDDVSTSTRKER